MKYTLLTAILFLTVFNAVFAQDREHKVAETVKKNAEKLLKDRDIRSASVGIYLEGRVYTYHFGEIEKGKGTAPDDETLYEIGSVSKTMIGYLAARAVEEEKIHLEDDIRTYLKEDFKNLEYNGHPLRIVHLLTHTGGLPKSLPLKMNGIFEKLDEQVPYEYHKQEKVSGKEQFLADLKTISLSTEPGTRYSYSSVGAELMGYILEGVYQKTLDELLQESFLTKTGMHTTAISLTAAQQQKLIKGYWMKNTTSSPNQLNTLWGAGGGVKSTLPDLMKYAELQLDTRDPIVSKSHEILYEEGRTLKVAYFWRVWTDKYGTSYNHHGGTSGVQNWLYIYPEYNLGIAILTNHSGPKTAGKLSKTVQKILKDIVKE